MLSTVTPPTHPHRWLIRMPILCFSLETKPLIERYLSIAFVDGSSFHIGIPSHQHASMFSMTSERA